MGTNTIMPDRSVQYYALIKHWASDMEFFKIETDFLYRLLDKHFMLISDSIEIKEIKQLGMLVSDLERDEKETERLINQQLKQIEWQAKNLIKENKVRTLTFQAEIDYRMQCMMNEFRKVRTDVFTLAEGVKHIIYPFKHSSMHLIKS